jgi:4-amino-4-deoxy-L-arabinose transferase-like glycosyltransferase
VVAELPCDPSPDPLIPPRERTAALLLAVLLIADGIFVLTPEIGKDALIYHLAVPKLTLAHGGFYAIAGNVFSGYPLLGEMHYLAALAAGSETLAKAMHFVLLGGTLLGIGLLSRLIRGNAFPVLAMLIFASIPVVFQVSHSSYNDLFVACFTLAALYAFLRWREGRLRGWLALAALFCGAAAACKYTALLLFPLGVLGILWSHAGSRESRAALGDLLLYGLAFLVAAGPFYLKSWVLTGNPFYPFFWGVFGGRGWDADQARLYEIFVQNLGMGRSLKDYLLLPWNLSLRARTDSPLFDGILGPIFLFTLPFLAGVRRWGAGLKVLLLYGAAAFCFWASSAQQSRYLIPLFAVLAVVVGVLLAEYRDRSRPIFRLLILIVAGSLAFNAWEISREFAKIRPLPVAAGLEGREAFLARTLPLYPLYRDMNRELPPGSRVMLVFVKNFTYLCERDCYADAMFEAHTLQKALAGAESPEAVRLSLRGGGFTHLMYDETFLLGARAP